MVVTFELLGMPHHHCRMCHYLVLYLLFIILVVSRVT